MARRKPFDEYKVTSKEKRIAQRKKLRKMQTTKKFDDWLIWMIAMQHNECYYCEETVTYADRESYHIDHRVPVYWGGKSQYSNLCLACPDCNRTKSTDQLVRNKKFLNDMNSKKRNTVIYL